MLMTALVVGIVFLQADDDYSGVQDRYVYIIWKRWHLSFSMWIIYRIGAMFFAIANAAFINITAVGVFFKEKPLFV